MEALTAIFEHGGILMYALLVVSLFLWGLLLYRWSELRREPVSGYALAQELVDRYQVDGTVGAVLDGKKGILANALRQLFSCPRPNEKQLEAAILSAHEQIDGPHEYLKVLIGIAPLLGLLGTVAGMTETFVALGMMGSSEPQALSSGISKALITTQAGLCIAVAGMFGKAWIERRENRLHAGFERARLVLAQILETTR